MGCMSEMETHYNIKEREAYIYKLGKLYIFLCIIFTHTKILIFFIHYSLLYLLLFLQLLVNNNKKKQLMMMNMESIIDYYKVQPNNSQFGYPFLYENGGYSLNNNNPDDLLPVISRKRARDNNNSYSQMFLGQDMISSQIHQQHFEIDQFVKHHSENMRLEIEAKRRKTSRTLIAALEEGLQHQLRAKEDEITKMMKLNHALEEKLKSMCLENQIWRELAQTNEATANALRNNLKYVLDYKLGADVAAAEDAESCCESSNDISQHDSACKTTIPNLAGTDEESLGRIMCKSCGKEESNVLVLPCRHLCLCSGCAPSHDVCPVCKSTKNITLHVHLS